MASRSDMLGHGTTRGEEALSMPWRLEPLHPACSLPCGLVRIFRTVVERAMLPMFHARQDLPLRCAMAL
jgi:hypothetical protein